MVSISRKRIKGGVGVGRRTRGGNGGFFSSLRPFFDDSEKLWTAGLALVGSMAMVWTLTSLLNSGVGNSSSSSGSSSSTKRLWSADELRLKAGSRPNLHVKGPNSEAYNAIALDVITTLHCHDLLNKTTEVDLDAVNADAADGGDEFEVDQQGKRRGRADAASQEEAKASQEEDVGHFRRRRLQPIDDAGFYDDHFEGEGRYTYTVPATAKHLFCLAALASSTTSTTTTTSSASSVWKDRIHCDASHPSRQAQLLELWSTARSEIPDTAILNKVLEVSSEHERDFIGKRLHFWAPAGDDGLDYMLSVLNEEQKSVDHGGIYGLDQNLGPGKLFVDVGSCLGLTSMAVSILYPGTKLVSLEAAAPNWLLQEINWRCNSDVFDKIDGNNNNNNNNAADLRTVLLAGVGPSDHASQMAKMMWRPSATTSTRSWTPRNEQKDNDLEITVKLRPWHSVLAEANVLQQHVDVLNVDCEGCEYNLIPALTADEYDAISTVMGSVHWGYMPPHKLPSSERGKVTHERLCRHENFARAVKECCAFPDLAVISSVPGEVLVHDEEEGVQQRQQRFPPTAITVKDVAGSLCDDFDAWAVEHRLYDVDNDWGWFQITSMADE